MEKTVILLMVLSLVSKVIGFLKGIVLSYFYGASSTTDAYIIALSIPSIIFSLIGAGLSTAFIPMFSRISKEEGDKKANYFSNNLTNLIVVISSIIIILVQIFPLQAIKLFAPGFDEITQELAVAFLRIASIALYANGLLFIFQSYLQIRGNYTIPAIVGIPLNLIIIVSIIISAKTNILVLIIGSTLGSLSQLIMLIYYAYKENYKYKFTINFKDKYLKRMVFLALPVIVGASANQIDQMVDKMLASSIAVGGVSALDYAQKLDGFIKGIFIASIVTVLYPRVAEMAISKDLEGLKKSINQSLISVCLIVLPATVGAMVFSEEIVSLLFKRGAFGLSAVSMTSGALFYYSIGMLPYGLRTTLTKAFYALEDTKTPMINSTIAVVVNIILNIVLSRYMGLSGLALATSIAATLAMILMFISFRKRLGSFGMKQILNSFIKIIIASLTMGLIAKISFKYLAYIVATNLSLMLSIAIGATVYLLIVYFSKIEEVDSLIGQVKDKLSVPFNN